MSGQLVGEIGAARESGALDKLTQAQVLTLVGIAEKCHTDTRRGQVRLAYLMAWTGQSRRTVQRHVQALSDVGLIIVRQRGHKPNGGAPQAPWYELAALEVAPSMSDASSPDEVAPSMGDASWG